MQWAHAILLAEKQKQQGSSHNAQQHDSSFATLWLPVQIGLQDDFSSWREYAINNISFCSLNLSNMPIIGM
jgi:hypothetical protein